MKARTATLDSSGRLVIPREARELLELEPGGSVHLRLVPEGLLISTRARALARAQALVSQFVPEGRSLVDELIAERRAEAAKETM